jgi:choline dehydrogenase-like flavoprotein
MDGRSAGVEPALATGRAALLEGAEVLRLLPEGDRIAAVELRHGGALHRLRARRYVLCGGALGSARLLLASACEGWPEGLANRSGLVGRNLMFHVNEIFALWPRRGAGEASEAGGASGGAGGDTTKAVALRDFYHREGQRLGAVQAMGLRASYGEIAFYLNRMLAQRGLAGLQPLARLPAALAHRLLGSAQVFVGLMEDLPYAENRVTHDPARPQALSVRYSLSAELKARRRAFRRAIRQGLRGERHLFLTLAPELNWGHPCGTLRFGTDPTRSVLRPDCRSHDMSNLWVADASFMPTSMGVNPGLTVAANALRVADAMLGRAS